MPEAIQYWRCEFCRRKKAMRKSVTVKHESTCYKNPSRVPYPGELTFVGQTGKERNYGFDESINGTWLEWVEHDQMPAWWPGDTGMMWTGQEWLTVPGYYRFPAKPGHGCAGGAPDEEEWPEFDETPFHLMTAKRRLEVFPFLTINVPA